MNTRLSDGQKSQVLKEVAKLLQRQSQRRDRMPVSASAHKCGRGWRGTRPPGCVRSNNKKIAELRAKLISQERKETGIEPGSVGEMNPSDIKVDPARFQYKRLSNAKGEVGSLRGVKTYDPNLAGIIQVWRDPANGSVSVVNGHNRLALATRANAPKVAVRMLDVPDAKSARAVGALTNIAEGRGDALDSAKFFRDSGITRDDLERKGIPMRERIATDGLAISKLDDSLYRKAMSGDMPVERAAIIGAADLAPEQQRSLAKLVENKAKHREITPSVLRELVDTAKSSATKTQTTMTLFGEEEIKQSLALEKAQLQAGIKRRLAREKKLFGTVGRSKAAQSLSKAGNSINVESSQAVSRKAAAALADFDRQKNLVGDVSAKINAAALRVANGESLKKVESELYRNVLSDVRNDSELREDKQYRSFSTKKGREKMPGKKCGGGYISYAYNCRSHRGPDGKLTAEGKAALKEQAQKIRARKGFGKRTTTSIDLNIAKKRVEEAQAKYSNALDVYRGQTEVEFMKKEGIPSSEIKKHLKGNRDLSLKTKEAIANYKSLKGSGGLAPDSFSKLSSLQQQLEFVESKRKAYLNQKAIETSKRNRKEEISKRTKLAKHAQKAAERRFEKKEPVQSALSSVDNTAIQANLRRRIEENMADGRISEANLKKAFNAVGGSQKYQQKVKNSLEKKGLLGESKLVKSAKETLKESLFNAYKTKDSKTTQRVKAAIDQAIKNGVDKDTIRSIKNAAIVKAKKKSNSKKNPDTLEELFLTAERIGNKYQTKEERKAFQEAMTKNVGKIADQIEKLYPSDNESEFVDYSGRSKPVQQRSTQTKPSKPSTSAKSFAKLTAKLKGKKQTNLFGGAESIPIFRQKNGKTKALTLDNLNSLSGEDRIKFAQAGIKEARKRGDLEGVRAWTAELGRSQKAAFAQTKAQQKKRQGSLLEELGQTEFEYSSETPLFSTKFDSAELRKDRRQVLMKTVQGRTKRPGKPCGKTYISPLYRCQNHFTNGKLNAEGKAAMREYAKAIKKKKGMPDKAKSKAIIKSAKAKKNERSNPISKIIGETATPQSVAAAFKYIRNNITSKEVKATVLADIKSRFPATRTQGDVETAFLKRLENSVSSKAEIDKLKGKASRARSERKKNEYLNKAKQIELNDAELRSRYQFSSPKERSKKFDDQISIEAEAQMSWLKDKSGSGNYFADEFMGKHVAQAIGITLSRGKELDSSKEWREFIAKEINDARSPSIFSKLGASPSKQAIKAEYRKASRTAHPDTGGSKEAFAQLTDQYKKTLRRYGYLRGDSIFAGLHNRTDGRANSKLWIKVKSKVKSSSKKGQQFVANTKAAREARKDAWQSPKANGKALGVPCGAGWISANKNCSPEKQKIATQRLKEEADTTAKYVARLRKAKGIGPGKRDKQLSAKFAKRLAAMPDARIKATAKRLAKTREGVNAIAPIDRSPANVARIRAKKLSDEALNDKALQKGFQSKNPRNSRKTRVNNLLARTKYLQEKWAREKRREMDRDANDDN